jgi:hypothetical protein
LTITVRATAGRPDPGPEDNGDGDGAVADIGFDEDAIIDLTIRGVVVSSWSTPRQENQT